MIIPFETIIHNGQSLELLAEAPLNTKPIATVYARGTIRHSEMILDSLITTTNIWKFISQNKIIAESNLSFEECALLDAYAKLIIESSKVGANAAEIIERIYSKEETTNKRNETITLVAKVYKLPNIG